MPVSGGPTGRVNFARECDMVVPPCLSGTNYSYRRPCPTARRELPFVVSTSG